MSEPFTRRFLRLVALFLGLWLGIRYLFPILLPFLLGGLLALMAEPAVGLGVARLRLPRWLSAGIGVTLTLALLLGLLSLLGGLLLREVGTLAQTLPDVQQMADRGITLLQDWSLSLTKQLPQGIRELVSTSVRELSGGGTSLVEQVTVRLPSMTLSLLGSLSSGALGAGFGLLAAYLCSARLPQLRQQLSQRIPASWKSVLSRVRKALGGWLKAQLLLLAMTCCLLLIGFLLLQVPFWPVWAVLVALVDAIPMLGTGTVLIPWALIEILQQQPWRAAGLLALYAVTLVTRTVLEPRLVGKQVGLDPLMVLISMYAGYRLFGVFGLLLAPLAAAAVKAAMPPEKL